MQGSRANRIRQGGPGEDKALAAHILELQPRKQQLAEAAQLCELLIMLGHEADARTLQQARPAPNSASVLPLLLMKCC